MPIDYVYACDVSGKACADSDIASDETGATFRVMLDARVYYRRADGTVAVKQMGQHVFASVADAIEWAQGITVP